jgi:hypothetical protein
MSRTTVQSGECANGARTVRSFGLCLPILTLLFCAGCTYESTGKEPETLQQKQEETARDPIDYKPDNENTKPYDISGGGFNNLDTNALKKDIDHVLDP